MSYNEQLYIEVVQAHFKLNMSVEEIVRMLKIDIKGYRHQTHEGKIMFTNPKTAIETIIECEKQAHLQALNFEYK